nr:hypothetical protein [Tanacetum cinerariifolium]
MRRVGKDFSGRDTPLFLTMLVQPQADMGEGLTIPSAPQHTTPIIQPTTSKPQKKQKPRKLISVKENQEKDKIRSKPDKNGKRVEAGKSLKQLHQDPLKDREGEKSRKRRQIDVGGSSSNKSKAQVESPHYESGDDDDEEPRHEENLKHEIQFDVLGKQNFVWFQKTTKELPIQSWFHELVDDEDKPEENEFINDKINWTNPEGDMFNHDLSKPLPLVSLPGSKRIPISYFFNHDLKYLKYRTEENMYALSVIKIKAARYKDEGFEEIISYLWSLSV